MRLKTTSRIFVRLFVLDYKMATRTRRQVIVIQSVLCEDALSIERTVVV